MGIGKRFITLPKRDMRNTTAVTPKDAINNE